MISVYRRESQLASKTKHRRGNGFSRESWKLWKRLAAGYGNTENEENTESSWLFGGGETIWRNSPAAIQIQKLPKVAESLSGEADTREAKARGRKRRLSSCWQENGGAPSAENVAAAALCAMKAKAMAAKRREEKILKRRLANARQKSGASAAAAKTLNMKTKAALPKAQDEELAEMTHPSESLRRRLAAKKRNHQ